jgi:hypothetical protein
MLGRTLEEHIHRWADAASTAHMETLLLETRVLF